MSGSSTVRPARSVTGQTQTSPGAPPRPASDKLDTLLASHEVERTLGWLFNDIHRLLGRGFELRARDLGMTRAQWRALMLIHRNDGLTQTELADLIDMEKAPFGRLLDKLEQGGWIERRPDPKDRRANRVHATDRILPLVPNALEAAQALFADALDGLSPAEVDALIVQLSRIKQNLIASEPAPPESSEPE